eukprot:358247-Chlamydomonas_euryale.AAC.9
MLLAGSQAAGADQLESCCPSWYGAIKCQTSPGVEAGTTRPSGKRSWPWTPSPGQNSHPAIIHSAARRACMSGLRLARTWSAADRGANPRPAARVHRAPGAAAQNRVAMAGEATERIAIHSAKVRLRRGMRARDAEGCEAAVRVCVIALRRADCFASGFRRAAMDWASMGWDGIGRSARATPRRFRRSLRDTESHVHLDRLPAFEHRAIDSRRRRDRTFRTAPRRAGRRCGGLPPRRPRGQLEERSWRGVECACMR